MANNWIVKLQTWGFAIFQLLFILSASCQADTFTNRQTGEVLHGFSTLITKGSETVIHSQEKGITAINLAQWTISPDRIGRNNKVVVLTFDCPIKYEIETAAFERAIEQAVHEGPLFILLQINTPGGRTDYAQRFGSAIGNTANCPVIAFVKGGQFGGAVSAGVALALACDKIYIANDATIGAASMMAVSGNGMPQPLEEIYDKQTAEKLNSAWRAYLASLAEKHGRPALIARAMVDKGIEVIEVLGSGEKVFIEPANKKAEQKLIRIWNKKDSLLTLTAKEALECRMADKPAESVADILKDMDSADAEVRIDNSIQEASTELKRANGQLNRILKSIDLKIKQAKEPLPDPKALSILRSARSEFQTLVKLAKRYPDLQLNIKLLEEELNSIEAHYQKLRIDSNSK